jgi:hypothetical protein
VAILSVFAIRFCFLDRFVIIDRSRTTKSEIHKWKCVIIITRNMSNSGSSNKYNDPTLPGYDPSRPAGTAAQSTSRPSSQPSSSSSINRYNDPTLPGYDPSRPIGTEQYGQEAEKPRYTPPPRSLLPPHLRGYFPAPKL